MAKAMSLDAAGGTADQSFGHGVAVVVGGSGGVGRAVCRLFAERGVNVAFTYRKNKAAADFIVKELTEDGVRCSSAAVDITDRKAVEDFITQMEVSFGRIHTVVFAAGSEFRLKYVAETDPDEWHRTIESDLSGFFHIARAALPALRRAKGSSIVAVTSAGVARHPPLDILSTVPKSGVEALVRGIAREEGRFGIRANAVGLGVIDGGVFIQMQRQLTGEFVNAMRRNTSLRRFGTEREAAEAIVFLASPAAGFITGQSLIVDGGYSV